MEKKQGDDLWRDFLIWHDQALRDEAIAKGLPPDTYTKQTAEVIRKALEDEDLL